MKHRSANLRKQTPKTPHGKNNGGTHTPPCKGIKEKVRRWKNNETQKSGR